MRRSTPSGAGRGWLAAAAIALLLVPLAKLAAQSARATQISCAPSDSVYQPIFATLGPASDTAGTPGVLSAMHAEHLAMALSEMFGDWSMPEPSMRPAPGIRTLALHAGDSSTRIPSPRLSIAFRIDSGGSASVLSQTVSGIPTLDSALRHVIERTSRDGRLWFLALADTTVSARHAAPRELLLRLDTKPDSLRPAAQLGSMRLPLFDFSPARVLPGTGRPVYPREARDRGMPGKVVAEFVVQENGRVDMDSYRLVSTSNVRFNEATRVAVARARFRPARMGSCTVPMWVQMPFNYELRR